MGTITEPTAQRVAGWSGYPAERILGTADIARRFGVTRQRVGQIARTDRTFPRPGLHDGAGQAWVAAGIECWAAAHRPAADTGRFGPEAAALLRHAEAVAERLGNGWVSMNHIWHAIASGIGGAAVADALASMGLDLTTVEEAIGGMAPETTKQRRMTPRLQSSLEAADKAVRTAGRPGVLAADVLLASIDERRHGKESSDPVISYAERRGLDLAELRRRVVVVAEDREAARAFPPVPLPKRRPARRKRRRPAAIDFAPNSLGHDPWERHPWGSIFAVTAEGRHLTVDGRHWFFYMDADGYLVRTRDGRPVGYSWPVLTKVPKRMPRFRGLEVLPMPPVPMRDWPDRRYVAED